MSTERKRAPEEVMIVGYFATEARHAFADTTEPYGGDTIAYGYAYLTSAVNAVPAARLSLERDLKNRGMWPSDGLYDLDVSCEMAKQLAGQEYVSPMARRKVSNLIGRGHQKLARMMARLGYAEITDEDFTKLRRTHNLPGGGGGR